MDKSPGNIRDKMRKERIKENIGRIKAHKGHLSGIDELRSLRWFLHRKRIKNYIKYNLMDVSHQPRIAFLNCSDYYNISMFFLAFIFLLIILYILFYDLVIQFKILLIFFGFLAFLFIFGEINMHPHIPGYFLVIGFLLLLIFKKYLLHAVFISLMLCLIAHVISIYLMEKFSSERKYRAEIMKNIDDRMEENQRLQYLQRKHRFGGVTDGGTESVENKRI